MSKTHRPMTVARLHKLLGELIQDGFSRSYVCVDKRTFTHPLEADGVVYLHAYGVAEKHHELMDDDGGMKTRKDGSVCYANSIVIYGFETHPNGEQEYPFALPNHDGWSASEQLARDAAGEIQG